MEGYTKSDLSIFTMLIQHNKVNEIKSVSYEKLCEWTGLSYQKVSQTIKKAIEDEFVKEGMKDGHKKRFYITSKGIKTIADLQ